MANKITDMSKIRKVIKFYSNGKSKLFISSYLSLSRNTVKKYISLYEILGLSPNAMNAKTDAELELLFSNTTVQSISPKLQSLYDFFPKMERELKKVGITIHHMWEQYLVLHPDGFQSSQFRHHYKIWGKRVNPVMHMNHKSGGKMYVDYAGKTLSIIDKESGELKEVQFFVAILGASQYPFGLKHEGYNLTQGNPYYKYQFGSKELQSETRMLDYGWRQYMPELGRWNSIDKLSESYASFSPYAYVMNNPIMFFDPNGMLSQAFMNEIMNSPNGTTWTNNGNGFSNNWVGMMDYEGKPTNYLAYSNSSSGGGGGGGSDGYSYFNIAEIVMNAKGNKSTWNTGANFGYNSYMMLSKITGALGDWNLQQNRAFFYNEVVRTGADKVERNFYFMFGGMLAAPFAASYIATLGGETVVGYLQGSAIRGVTDMALQQTIKGSIDWKQTSINAFIGGGSGLGATQVNWLNYGGNMINNFGTSIYDGTFNHDFNMNSMKALTGIFGMGVANYNGLTNGYLSGYFGTTLLPGIYFNTTDVIIELNKNKR